MQAWKDIKVRYKKTGIDLKGIINTLKTEQVVNTQMLLTSVEKLSSSKGKIQVERIIEENDPDKSSVEINVPGVSHH